MLEQLRNANPGREILSLDSPKLAPYGRVVEGDFSDLFSESLQRVDVNGPSYIRDVEELHRFDSFKTLRRTVYSDAPLQAGLCFGMNTRMNGMEYHRGSEVVIAVTECVLILGLSGEIRERRWDSSLAKCVYLPKGSALELFEGTMHLAPCRVTAEPFCTVIVLPEGTNCPMEEIDPSDPLKFMTNKWLICHEESPAVAKGGFVGITGDNIRIIPVSP